MAFQKLIIIHKEQNSIDTFTLRVQPIEGTLHPFKPGQYSKIRNPNYEKPYEEHTFSIASSPNTKDYLEFYIRSYGNWTKALAECNLGDILEIDYPFGNFIFDEKNDRNTVFLVGGVGISPIMSMLRYIHEQSYEGKYKLIYGSRTPETIAYKETLESLETHIKKLEIVHIFSDLKPENTWSGYRGFVTKDIIEKEIDFSLKPTIFVIGPPIFIGKMAAILETFPEGSYRIKKEVL